MRASSSMRARTEPLERLADCAPNALMKAEVKFASRAYSQVIYWWTSDELENDRAFRVGYNGYVRALPKRT